MRAYDFATMSVLVRRELKRFFRQKSRIAGALMQPLLFWFILGSGLAPSFHVQEASGLNYLEYFFPGVVSMIVLFTAIFSTMTLIEDRQAGFLQAVLAAPSSRTALALGKILGGTCVALIQISLFLFLAPLAGFHYAQINWPELFLILFFTAISFTAFGFFLAWWLNSTQGYHAIMSVVLIPLWLLSGAAFPLKGSASIWLKTIMVINPMTYSVEGIRHAFYKGALPGGTGPLFNSMLLCTLVVLFFMSINITLAIFACRKSRL